MTPVSGRPLVLIVEDHLDTRDMYAWALEASGFDVVTADDASGGFELAAERNPHVVVTDFWLRGVPSGADLCNRLKADVRTSEIPTLLVTGSTQREHAERALTAGCAVIRLKPYLPDDLERDIRLLLAGSPIAAMAHEHTTR
jgi:two-component system phosphate regulon response regulator PhoB